MHFMHLKAVQPATNIAKLAVRDAPGQMLQAACQTINYPSTETNPTRKRGATNFQSPRAGVTVTRDPVQSDWLPAAGSFEEAAMGIHVTCQCGQAFSAMAELAGRTLPCPNCGRPLSIPQPLCSGTRQSSGCKFDGSPATSATRKLSLVVVAIAATAAVAALAAWLVWSQLGSRRDVAAQPAAGTPRREARSSRSQRREAPRPGTRSTTAASPGGTAAQIHRSHDGAIEFWLPAGAKSEVRRSFGTSAGLAERTRVTWGDRKTGELEGTVYLYRGTHDDLAADTEMKVGWFKGLYKIYASRVTQNYRDITHGEFTGTEADIHVTGERDNTFRFLYYGDYLVTLEAIGPPGFAASAPAKKFFNSLRMVDGKE